MGSMVGYIMDCFYKGILNKDELEFRAFTSRQTRYRFWVYAWSKSRDHTKLEHGCVASVPGLLKDFGLEMTSKAFSLDNCKS